MLQETSSRKCKGCGVDISDKSLRFQYCSEKCRVAPRFRGKYCPHCGGQIVSELRSNHRRKYCSRSCSRKSRYKRDNPFFNEDFFSKPDLENSYWAGFIAADGCVLDGGERDNQLVIGLNSKDGYHLEKLKSSIRAGKIDYHKSKVRYRLSSNKVCDDLRRVFNITPRKSLALKPPKLNTDCAYAFIAGYVDGDGCYRRDRTRPRITFVGTYEILSWMMVVYGIEKTPKKTGNIFRIDITGDNAIQIRDSYCDMDLPLLERKKNRWEELGLNLKILKGE